MPQFKKKIKILKAPSPIYQQDRNTLSLDTHQIFPNQFIDKQADDYRDQYPEADIEDANIEAERGENIITPDFANYTIGGKLHSQGGTPLEVEPGSFIYSNDKKLRIKGDVLSEFGINPNSKKALKGYTPADIAKKYRTNKFLDKLKDPDSDDLDKDTSMMVMGNMKNKLGKLAFIQEAMKGFPDGIPEMVSNDEEDQKNNTSNQGQYKMGGSIGSKKRYQDGGGITPEIRRQARLVRTVPQGAKFLGKLGTESYYGTTDGGYMVVPQAKSANVFMKNQQWLNYLQNKYPYASGEDLASKRQISRGNINLWNNQYRKYSNNNYYYTTDPIPSGIQPPGGNLPGIMPRSFPDVEQPPFPNTRSEQDLKTFENPVYDTGYGTMDYINMAAPYLIPLKKYNPIRINVTPQSIPFRPIDLEAQRQAIRGQVGQAETANALLGSSASMASARNSQLLGSGLDAINQSFSNEFNTNQQGRMQVEGQNAQFRQQANLFNAEQDDQYNARTAMVNENFDNEKRLRLQQFLKGLNTAERTRQTRNAANIINQDYYITADGRILRKQFSPDQAEARLFGQGMNSGYGAQTPTMDDFKRMYPSLANDPGINQKYWEWIRTTYTGRNSYGQTVVSRNPYMAPYDSQSFPQ